MYILESEYGNVRKETESEIIRDRLIAIGYHEIVKEKAKEENKAVSPQKKRTTKK